MINIDRYGILLHVEKYEACVEFYRHCLNLPVELQKSEPAQRLTIFSLGNAYLMVEPGGLATDAPKTATENPVTLRLNTASVEQTADRLRQAGIHVAIQSYEWGTIGDFLDPDGNRCQLRDAGTFGR